MSNVICSNACVVAEEVKAKAILTITYSGFNTIKIDNINYKIPTFLISNNLNSLNSEDIYNGLSFSRTLMENKFFNPNNLRFPHSRKLLEKKFL